MDPFEKLQEDGYEKATYVEGRYIQDQMKNIEAHPDGSAYFRIDNSHCWRPYDPDLHKVKDE